MPRRKPIGPQTLQKRRRLRRNNQALVNWDRILGGSEDIVLDNNEVANAGYMDAVLPSTQDATERSSPQDENESIRSDDVRNHLQLHSGKASDDYSCDTNQNNLTSTSIPAPLQDVITDIVETWNNDITVEGGDRLEKEESNYIPLQDELHDTILDQNQTDAGDQCLGLNINLQSDVSSPSSPQIDSGDYSASLQKILTFTSHNMTSNYMLGIQLLYGKIGFTIAQYEVLSSIFKHFSNDNHLPSHSTLRFKIWPYMFSNLFANSCIKSMPTNQKTISFAEHSRSLSKSTKSIESQEKQVSMILPSEWAARDIAHIPFLSSVFSFPKKKHSERGIEDSDIVRCAEKLYKSDRMLWIRDGENYQVSNIGDIVCFGCVLTPTFKDFPVSKFGWKTRKCTEEGVSFDTGIQCEVEGEIVAFWSPAGTNSTIRDHCFPKISHLCNSVLMVLKFLSENVTTPSTASKSKLYPMGFTIFPGDVCTILVPGYHMSCSKSESTSQLNNSIAVHVSRFWRTRLGRSYNFIAWFHCDGVGPLEMFDITKTSESPRLISSSSEKIDETYIEPTGILCTGQRYYIYRFVLYADDFNPRSILFPRGSVGGVYMLPMGLPVKQRRGFSSVRPVSLTPSGVSTNNVLDALIVDLKQGIVEGFDSIDAFGNNVRILLHLVGFIGDYPAASDVIDVMKHSANAPCTLCTFRRRRIDASTDFAFTTSVHSRHSSFRRGLFRTVALRSSDISTEEEKWLGMSNGKVQDIFRKGRWPQLKLATELFNNRERNPAYLLDSDRKPIVLDNFDPYCANVTAPDHCLTGLINGVLQLVFLQLPDEEMKIKLDIIICTKLGELDITCQTSVYNSKAKKTNTLSMSSLYGIILILPTVLRTLEIHLPISNLARVLQKLVGLIFWWPSAKTDGPDVMSLVHGKNVQQYHRRLILVCRKFTNLVSIFCSSFPEKKSYIDRPNMHRLFELVAQNIPMYGHALLISEMMFEAMHQPLKRSISKDTNSRSHISAIRHALYKDWLLRLSDLWYLYNNSTVLKRCENTMQHLLETDSESNLQDHVMGGLCRLYCGEGYTHVLKTIITNHSTEEEVSAVESEDKDSQQKKLIEISSFVISSLRGLFGNYLLSSYSSIYPLIFEEQEWVGFIRDTSPRKPWFEEEKNSLLQELKRKTINFYEFIFPGTRGKTSTIVKAIFQRRSGSRILRANSHHILRAGDSFEVTVRAGTLADRIVDSQKDGTGEKGYFFIFHLFKGYLGSFWAAVSRLKKLKENIYGLQPCSKDGFQLVQLTESVRKVLVFHACDVRTTCKIDISSRTTVHQTTLLSGDMFYVLRRCDGYPSRSA